MIEPSDSPTYFDVTAGVIENLDATLGGAELRAGGMPLATCRVPDQLLERAKSGDADAQLELAARYRNRSSLSIDREHALVWLKSAASSGHLEAQYQLGMAYLRGEGCKRSPQQALETLL